MKAPFVLVQAALLCTFFVKANADPYEKIEVRVNHGMDDTEEYGYVPGGTYGSNPQGYPLASGYFEQYHYSTDLELASDPAWYSDYGPQVIGIRIENLEIPKGAQIRKATLTFQAKDQSTGNSPDLVIKAIKGNQARITAQTRLMDKTLTSAQARWNNLPNWQDNIKYESPNLKNIVQEVIDTGSWTRGSAIMFVIRGDSTYYTPYKRRAWSYDGNAAKAPVLKVEFTTYGVKPCVVGETNSPQGCHPRIKKCEDFVPHEYSGVVVKHTDTDCAATPTLASFIKGDPDSPENIFFVKFSASGYTGDPCYGIVMRGGECWGTNPINNDDYDCQGKCGPGCGEFNTCTGWGFDCLRHDACSWFFGASGKNCHEHCGDEWWDAYDDYISNWNCPYTQCGVALSGCGASGSNPPTPYQISTGGGLGGRRALEAYKEASRVKKENRNLKENTNLRTRRGLLCIPLILGGPPTAGPTPYQHSSGGGFGGR